jgi:DNA-binding NarL/FixJ family response regulator
MKLHRVIVADDHDRMRSSIVALLSERFQVVGAVSDGGELIQCARCLLPDVIVSDIFMGGLGGILARDVLIDQGVIIPFVFVSGLGKEIVSRVSNDSPVAFVYKVEMLDHLVNAMAAVLAGQQYLSPYYGGYTKS